ncbi:MAG: biopolymer transporter ExbD [Symplocastrum torsivum CPER-KK1]|jgi:biopolymer transport protein ExbD|uniref:Biopolymer transporter ExbD n=1 Tax=Symplocastrum torsivum CPER-KK1 TaxID=450513 RepID=A0A951PMM3_9CYAN|nr:biopolymer transporter ExbD [Symplocastrum torsivum CPER-KK1]
MRFKSKQKSSQMPEINLVPMMDVIMTILTFFIIVSMTLTNQQNAVNVTLPSADKGLSEQKIPDPLVVSINQQGKLFLGKQQITEAQLAQPMQAYLQQHPEGAVVLNADRKLPYEEVVKVLGKMRDIGGDRVSLAIES